jgi:hypothetical protein
MTRRRRPRKPPPEALLVSRRDAAVMLGGVCVASMKRYEERGILRPVKIDPESPSSPVFYALAEIKRIAAGGVSERPQPVGDE